MNEIPPAWAAWMIGGIVVVGIIVAAVTAWAPPGFIQGLLPH